ncbi:MAG: LamG domain-containing protein, partial [Candidatus Kariarchaeaceae archaeon]
MGRHFTRASSQYAEVDATPFVDEPITMACWFRTSDLTNGQTLIWTGDKDVSNKYHWLYAAGDVVGDPIRILSISGGPPASADTTAGYSSGVWNHACAVIAAGEDRRVFLNGGNKGTDTGRKNPGNPDRLAIGGRRDSVPTAYMDGDIAEVAIWDVALTDAEVAILGKGFSPEFVQPGNLVSYKRLIRDTQERINKTYDWTTDTSTYSDHPPIIYPAPVFYSFP